MGSSVGRDGMLSLWPWWDKQMEEARCSPHCGGCIGPSVICSCFVLKSWPCLDIQWLQSGKIPFHLRWCIDPHHFNSTCSTQLWPYVYARAQWTKLLSARARCVLAVYKWGGVICNLCKLTATCIRVLLSITQIMRDMDQGIDWKKIARRKRKEKKDRIFAVRGRYVRWNQAGWGISARMGCDAVVLFILSCWLLRIYISPVK